MENIDYAEIKKQVEYFLGDENLATDNFFRDTLITPNKEGWMDIGYMLTYNKIKKLGVYESKQIADACKDSTVVEVDGDNIRRIGNKALPAFTGKLKKEKRENKVNDNK